MRRNLTPDQRADRLASRQYGLLSRAQALANGLTRHQIEARVASARWILVAPSVYRIAGAPTGWQQNAMAACLAGPAGTVGSHLTAGALYTWCDPPLLPHVTVGRSASARKRIFVAHRANLSLEDRTLVGGIPATSPARTVIDAATVLTGPLLIDFVDNALCSPITNVSPVLAALDRAAREPGRKGSGELRRLLEDWDPRIMPGSPAELRALRLLRQWGFEPPVQQFVVRGPDGAFVGRLDLAWPRHMVGVEYDSVRFHAQNRWRRDEARYAALRAAGFEVLSMDKADLVPGERRLRDDLERALRARSAA